MMVPLGGRRFLSETKGRDSPHPQFPDVSRIVEIDPEGGRQLSQRIYGHSFVILGRMSGFAPGVCKACSNARPIGLAPMRRCALSGASRSCVTGAVGRCVPKRLPRCALAAGDHLPASVGRESRHIARIADRRSGQRCGNRYLLTRFCALLP